MPAEELPKIRLITDDDFRRALEGLARINAEYYRQHPDYQGPNPDNCESERWGDDPDYPGAGVRVSVDDFVHI